MEATRILYVNHKRSPLTLPHLKALRALEYQVTFFDYYQPDQVSKALGFLVNKRLILSKSILIRYINYVLISKAKQLQPSHIVVVKGLDITTRSLKELKTLGIITINWFPDFWEFLPWMRSHVSSYDYFFDADLLVVKELKKKFKSVYYLPYATNPDTHLSKEKKEFDLVFVGQWTKRRERMFSKVADLGLSIWGYQNWSKSSLAHCYRGELPNLEAVLDIFRRSKIILNIVTGEDEIPVKTVNLRVFEVTGVGGFLLNWYKDPIDDFFIENREIVNFRNARDLKKKIGYYLTHEKERERIAHNGWKRTVKHHTFEARFKELMSIVIAG